MSLVQLPVWSLLQFILWIPRYLFAEVQLLKKSKLWVIVMKKGPLPKGELLEHQQASVVDKADFIQI